MLVLHVFYIQFTNCILSESNSSKNDAFSHCRGYCKPLQYKLFQSTTLYVHLAVMQTKAFNVVNALFKNPISAFMPFADISFGLYLLLSKGGGKKTKNVSTNSTKGSTLPGGSPHPSSHSPSSLPAPPPSTHLCSSELTCLSISKGLVEIKMECITWQTFKNLT